MARRLRKPHVAWDDRFEHEVAEAFADVVGNLIGQPVAPIEHGQGDTDNAEIGIETPLDPLNCL